MIEKIKNIAATIGVVGTILGVVWAGFEYNKRIHTDPESVKEAEEFFRSYDEKKAYGEYIMDSIEEVNTQARWKEQQEINKEVLSELRKIDSLTRLGVRITDETRKAYLDTH